VGILEKLRAEMVDIIEWLDDDRHTLVWRFPRYHSQIKNGARLIVRPGQVAIFVHQGTIADVFEPGTHVLETRNLPIFSTLAGWMHGFDSPFKADVYFVATRQVTDLKWGTPNPVILRDATFGPIRVRAFGTYTLRANDPRRLLAELVGTDSRVDTDELGEVLRAAISSCFADMIATADIHIVDLASQYQKLSDRLRAMVVERVGIEFGIDLPQFHLVNISLPEEVEKALDARTSMAVIGDLAHFQQYQAGKAIPVAAANPAGGLAGAGVGLGMGMAAAGSLNGLRESAPVPPVAWHFAEEGRAQGPFGKDQLAAAVAVGRVGPSTFVWCAGMASWTPASQVPALAALFAAAPPPLPR
jgi:membrane protease subunit (stomatin/prohibitin family)